MKNRLKVWIFLIILIQPINSHALDINCTDLSNKEVHKLNIDGLNVTWREQEYTIFDTHFTFSKCLAMYENFTPFNRRIGSILLFCPNLLADGWIEQPLQQIQLSFGMNPVEDMKYQCSSNGPKHRAEMEEAVNDAHKLLESLPD